MTFSLHWILWLFNVISLTSWESDLHTESIQITYKKLVATTNLGRCVPPTRWDTSSLGASGHPWRRKNRGEMARYAKIAQNAAKWHVCISLWLKSVKNQTACLRFRKWGGGALGGAWGWQEVLKIFFPYPNELFIWAYPKIRFLV